LLSKISKKILQTTYESTIKNQQFAAIVYAETHRDDKASQSD